MYNFIEQRCIKRNKNDSKDIYNVTKDFVCITLSTKILSSNNCFTVFWSNKCSLCDEDVHPSEK